MSLLDGPDVVFVRPEVETTDGDGNRVRRSTSTPVVVPGQWQNTGSTTDGSVGQQVVTTAIFRSRHWPSGAFGSVEYPLGRLWDIEGEPAVKASASGLITHTTVSLRAQAAAELA